MAQRKVMYSGGLRKTPDYIANDYKDANDFYGHLEYGNDVRSRAKKNSDGEGDEDAIDSAVVSPSSTLFMSPDSSSGSLKEHEHENYYEDQTIVTDIHENKAIRATDTQTENINNNVINNDNTESQITEALNQNGNHLILKSMKHGNQLDNMSANELNNEINCWQDVINVKKSPEMDRVPAVKDGKPVKSIRIKGSTGSKKRSQWIQNERKNGADLESAETTDTDAEM